MRLLLLEAQSFLILGVSKPTQLLSGGRVDRVKHWGRGMEEGVAEGMLG